jgi:hypothetical protein
MARYLAFLTGAGSHEERALHRVVLERSSLEEMWREVVRKVVKLLLVERAE